MAEVLAQFPLTVMGRNGVRYSAQACGARRDDGLWEGWIEFAPLGDGTPIRSGRETTQPNRADAAYWANGLTPVYLEGALERALHPLLIEAPPPAQPIFNSPAPTPNASTPAVAHSAVLNPFAAYGKGEALLRRELGALSEWHLVNIIRAYRLGSEPETTLNHLPRYALIQIIVSAVRGSLAMTSSSSRAHSE
jgi:hypothetical protein